MLARTVADQKTRVLIIDEKLAAATSFGGRAVRALVQELNGRGIETIESVSFADGRAAVAADASIDAILIGWTREGPAAETKKEGEALLTAIRRRNADVPVILLADRPATGTLNVDIMTMADEYVFLLEDTASFICSRVMAAIKRYSANLLPPFTKATARLHGSG